MANVIFMARFRGALSLLVAAAALTACNRDKILQVTDPDIINPSNLGSAEAAEALRLGALTRISDVTGGLQPTNQGAGGSLGEGIFHFSGAVADEWRSTDTFVQRDEADSRAITESNTAMTLEARGLHRTRIAAAQAIPVLQQFKPNNVADVGQMYWVRGWAEMSIAENFCNGMPLSSLDAANNIVYGPQLMNVEIYNRAIASFDTAVQNAPATEVRSDTVKWLAGIEKARVQLDLGDVTGAGTTISAAAVPDNFRFNVSYTQVIQDNQIWALNNSAGRWMPGNNEGNVGLNFFSANDPRVPMCIGGSAACKTFDPNQTRTTSFDNNFGPGTFLVQLVWPTREADISIATGTEARLIEAEVALRTGDIATWLTKLNQLRANFNTFKQTADPCSATVQITGCPPVPVGGALPPLVDPGSQTAREDLLFRERAFWLWSTGHRLADMRRLVRPTSDGGFGRAENSVFPNGPYYKGGVYGTDKFLVIPQAERNNPEFTKGCLDRNP
jgi:starch-binding outer membrane protein, SusD/RagB family